MRHYWYVRGSHLLLIVALTYLDIALFLAERTIPGSTSRPHAAAAIEVEHHSRFLSELFSILHIVGVAC